MITARENQRFCGREFTLEELFLIQEVAKTCAGISRTELSHTVCQLLDWRRAGGGLKARESLDLLERLEGQGFLTLPGKRVTRSRKCARSIGRTGEEQPWARLAGSVEAFAPVDVELVRSRGQRRLFRELVSQHHYLGYAMPYGARLQYLAYVSRPRREAVGCVQFSSPTWRMKVRDQWIGWDDVTRGRRFQHVVNNSRLLVLPRIRNLASTLLSCALRRLRSDWQGQYGVEPWLVETLVDRERFYDQARQEFEHIVRYLDSEEVRSMTHSELERELEKKGRELMRTLLQEHLDARGPGECPQPVRGSDGVERPRVRLQERKLETVFGAVSVERAGYGQEGTESLHPLDAELNLPDERYSLELRRRVAEEAAKSSFDETLESIRKTTGGHVPKRQIEELVMCAAQDFDAFYEMRQGQPAVGEQTGSVLVMSVDGKGVVMRTQDLREQTRKAAAARKHKMGTRLSKGEKKNAKRMATVAAVYTITPFVRQPEDLVAESNSVRAEPPRPRPEQKRLWASLARRPRKRSSKRCSRRPVTEILRMKRTG